MNTQITPEKTLVSVIIPVYNREHTLRTTLDSVAGQSYRPIEIVIVDDGSDDGSWEIIEEWVKVNKDLGLNIVPFSQNNAGAPAARNRGIEISSGRFVQFLDSDDLLSPEKIHEQVNGLQEHDGDVAICDFEHFNPDKEGNLLWKNSGPLRWKLALGHSLFVCTPLIDRQKIEISGLWFESLRSQQDVDFLLKVMMIAKKYIYTPGNWCKYCKHEGPQISDQYGFRPPPYGRRVHSLIRFAVTQKKDITLKGWGVLLTSVVWLGQRWLTFPLRRLVRKFLHRSRFCC